MLTLTQIRENPEELIKRLSVRNKDFSAIINKIIEKDDLRKKTKTESDNLLAESNKIAKEIGTLYKQGKRDEAEAFKNKAASMKDDIKEKSELLKNINNELDDLLYEIPNIPNKLVPKGNSDADNEVVKEGGTFPKLEKKYPHWELLEKFELADFETGSKITGAGFPLYTGKGAKLQRALINFFLDEAHKAGYKEVMPPLLINEASGYGTGQLPDKEGQMYEITADGLFLIPTAEVPVTNIFRDEILSEKDLPQKLTAYSSCFRREAGSYGKDVKGLNRLHQFDKVEIVQVCKPEDSYKILDKMVAHVESLIQKLELPYRIIRLCGGDLGFTSALTYDFEVYSAGQDKWLEVSSVSNFETFQANRLKLRYKTNSDSKPQLAHTLNGSALALPRIVAALIENNASENGIKIPEVLKSYTGFDKI